MTRTILALAAAMLLGTPGADAASIQLSPSALTVSPGDAISFELTAAGLGASVVGDYDLDISFDFSALTLTSVTPTDALGSIVTGEALDFSGGLTSPGLFNLSLVSTLSALSLDALQGDPILLATLAFSVASLPAGQSTVVGIGVNAFGDGAGHALALSGINGATLLGAGQTQPPTPPGTPVPEPATVLLCVSGLAWAGAKALRQRTSGR